MKKLLLFTAAILCLAGCNQNEPDKSFPVAGRGYQYYSIPMDSVRSYSIDQVLKTSVESYGMYFGKNDTVEYYHAKWHYVQNPEDSERAVPEYDIIINENYHYKQNGGKVTIYSSPESIVYSNCEDSIRYNGIFLKYAPRPVGSSN
jgi:hypothetical protein